MSNRQQVEAKESWDKGLWSLGKWGRCPLSLSACHEQLCVSARCK